MNVFASLFSKKRLGLGATPRDNAVLICEANKFFFCGYLLKKERKRFAQCKPITKWEKTPLVVFSLFFAFSEKFTLFRALSNAMGISLVATSDKGAALDPRPF